MQLLLPSRPTQTRKEAKRKEAVWVLCKAEGHLTLRLEVSNVAPAYRSQVTDSVRTWNQEVPPIPNKSPLCGYQASLRPTSRAEMVPEHWTGKSVRQCIKQALGVAKWQAPGQTWPRDTLPGLQSVLRLEKSTCKSWHPSSLETLNDQTRVGLHSQAESETRHSTQKGHALPVPVASQGPWTHQPTVNLYHLPDRGTTQVSEPSPKHYKFCISHYTEWKTKQHRCRVSKR